MSIEKKSLISTLKTTKKVNLTAPVVSQKDMKMKTNNTVKAAAHNTSFRAQTSGTLKAAAHNTNFRTFKSSSTKTFKKA